jgi:hypothetical protein
VPSYDRNTIYNILRHVKISSERRCRQNATELLLPLSYLDLFIYLFVAFTLGSSLEVDTLALCSLFSLLRQASHSDTVESCARSSILPEKNRSFSDQVVLPSVIIGKPDRITIKSKNGHYDLKGCKIRTKYDRERAEARASVGNARA